MAVKFANLASTTLASATTNSAASLTVSDASSFPSLGGGDYFYASIGEGLNSEIVKVTAVSSNTFTVTRGQDGTAAAAHSAGTVVALRVVAAALDDIASQAQTAADTESVSISGDTMTGALTTPGLTVSGNINVGEYLTHYADTDTSLRYQDNRATLKSGGGAILDLHSNGNVYLTGTTVQVYGDYISTGTISSGALSITGKFTQDANGSVNSVAIHDDDASGQPGIHITNALTGYTKEFYLKTYGSSVNPTIFGQSGANKSILATSGTSDTGLLIGTLSAQPVTIGVNNSARITIPSSGAINFHSQSLTSVGAISSTDLVTENNTTKDSQGPYDWVTVGSGSRAAALRINDIAGANYLIRGGGYGLRFMKHVDAATDSFRDIMRFTATGVGDTTPHVVISNNLTVGGNLTVTGSISGALASSVTATTQSASDNSTKVATTAYVDSAVSGIVDSAPGTLDTLNELAAALGDDANFSTTVTNSIATKLPKAGGTMTGAINMGSNNLSGINNATAVSFLSTNGYWVGGTQRMNGSGDLVNIGTISSGAITSSGNITGAGLLIDGNTAVDKSGNYMVFFDGSGAPALYAGNTADNRNYYQSNHHRFRSDDASTIFAELSSAGLRIGGASTPSEKLHVESGNIRVDGAYKVNGATVINSSRQFYVGGGSIQHSSRIAFLNGSDGNTGSGAQDIAVRSLYAGTSYSNTAPGGMVNALNGYQVGNTTVIDSSRNLTNVKISRFGTDIYAPYISAINTNTLNAGYGDNSDSSDMWINYRGYQDGFTKFRDFRIGDGKGTALLFVDGSSKAFDFQNGSYLQMAGTTVIDSSRNITAGTITATSVDSSGAVTGSSFTADQGDRTVAISNGTMTMKGSTGGWAFGLHALGSSNTNHGGFGFYGGADAFTYYYIGATYNNPTNFRFYKSGQLNIGTNTILDSSRNLTNIGTISSGAITSSGTVTSATIHNTGVIYLGSTATANDQFAVNTGTDIFLGTTSKGLRTYKDLRTNAGNNPYWHAGHFANNSANWNTAYGWGNHASAGYLGTNDNITVGTISSGAITSSGNVHLTNGDVTIGDFSNTNTGSLYLRGSTANKEARLYCSNGNLHMDSASGNSMYLNYYNGSSIVFGNGSTGSNANIAANGNFTTSGTISASAITSSGHITMTSNGHSVNTRSVLARDTNGLVLGSTNGTTAISIDNSSNVSMPYNLTVSGTISSGAITSTSTSTFGNIRLTDSSVMGFGTAKSAGSVGHTTSDDEGIFWHSSNAYGIYRTSGAWSSPNYQQLKIEWATGIILNGGNGYGKSGVDIIGSSDLKMGGTTVINSSRDITARQATFTHTDHNYVKIENTSVAKEQMVRFRNSQTNYWYAGIRTSAGIASTADFHIYSTQLGDDAFALTTSGDLVAKSNLNTKTGSIQINGTTVIDSSRNLTNIASATLSGFLNVEDIKAKDANGLNLQTDEGTKRVIVYDSGTVVINETGSNADFRVESDLDDHMLFVDASANAVGFGESSPYDTAWGTTSATRQVAIRGSSYGVMHIRGAFGNVETRYSIGAGGGNFYPAYDDVAGAHRLIYSSSEAVFNDSGLDYDFRVASDAKTHAFMVNGGTNRVGINTSNPASLFFIKADGSGYTGGLMIEDSDSSTRSAITHVDGALYLSSNTTTDTLTLDSSNNATFAGTITAGLTKLTPSGYATSPQGHAALNIGSAGSGETRAIDIWGSWSAGESKSITFNHGSSATQMVGQINVAYQPTTNTAGSSIRFGKLYHGGDSSLYVMELHSESTSLGYLNINRDMVQIGQDSTYAGYGVIGFGGRTNGYNRVFGHTGTSGGLFLASATGRGIFMRPNGGTADKLTVASDGEVQVAQGDIRLNDDGTYGAAYGAVGFGGVANGANRIFASNTTHDGLYLASATGRHVHIRTNGSSNNTFRFTAAGELQVGYGSVTFLDSARNVTAAAGHFTSAYGGGSGDYTNVTSPPLKIQTASGYFRIPHISASSTVSGVFNFETGKDVYWGEPSDTGNWYFRGRDFQVDDGDFTIKDGVLKIASDTVIDSNRNITAGAISSGAITSNADLTLTGNGTQIRFTGGNNRILFSGYRALEGAADGGNLQLGEGYTTVTSYGNLNLTSGHAYQVNGITVIDASTNGVFNSLRADGGNLIMGDEAYSTSADYVGIKTSHMSGSSDYMIISGLSDGNTYLSAKDGAKVFVRGGGNNGLNELEVTDSTFIRATTSNFYCTGNVTAYYSSDKSLKENIRVIDSPIEKIKQIRGVYFDWTDDYIKEQSGDGQIPVRKDDVGVIAQEVKPVLDEVVTTRDDGTLAVRYEKMVALCIEAIKEQQDQIDSLKTIIEEMKNGNN